MSDYIDHLKIMNDLIRPLVDEKDPFLREVPHRFDFDSPHEDPDKLEKRLIDNMYHYNGIGLSSNQIGISTKVFAMISDGDPMAVFNPEIVEWSDVTPFHNFWIENRHWVTIRDHCKHEMEHMEGELFINSVSDFKLKSAMKKRKILKRKAERKQRNG